MVEADYLAEEEKKVEVVDEEEGEEGPAGPLRPALGPKAPNPEPRGDGALKGTDPGATLPPEPEGPEGGSGGKAALPEDEEGRSKDGGLGVYYYEEGSVGAEHWGPAHARGGLLPGEARRGATARVKAYARYDGQE